MAGDAVWAQLQIGLAALDVLTMRIVQVGVEDLLGICKGAVEAPPNDGEVLGHFLVVDEVFVLPVVLTNLFDRVSQSVFTHKEVQPSN